jgi:hypothetical protein
MTAYESWQRLWRAFALWSFSSSGNSARFEYACAQDISENASSRLLQQEIFLFGNGLQLTDLSWAQLSFAYAPVDMKRPNAGLIGRTELVRDLCTSKRLV